MSEQQPSKRQITLEEARLQTDFYAGEKATTLETLEQFRSARYAIVDAVGSAMQATTTPEADSGDRASNQVTSASWHFVTTIKTIPNEEEQLVYAGALIQESAVELVDFMDKRDAPMTIHVPGLDDCIAGTKVALLPSNPESYDYFLARAFEGFYGNAVKRLMQYAESRQLEATVKIAETDESLTPLERFENAQEALLTLVDDILSSGAAITNEVSNEIDRGIITIAKQYVATILTKEDYEERVQYAGSLLHSAAVLLTDFVNTHDQAHRFGAHDVRTTTTLLQLELMKRDPEEHKTFLENEIGGLYQLHLEMLLLGREGR